MNVDLGKNYVLKSDARSLILAQRQTVREGQRAGETNDVTVGYYNTFDGVLKALLDREIRLSNATTLAELAKDYRQTVEFIRALCNEFRGLALMPEGESANG